MLLFVSKLFVAWWITLMSAIGVWLPIFYVRRNRDEPLIGAAAFARGKKAAASLSASASTKWYLSLANCVSAGMLLTMALLHFFPESFEAPTTGAAPPPATALCAWMLVGILIPAVLERSMRGGGGHSHGVGSESDGDHSHGEAGGSGSAVSTSTLLIVLMCFHGMTEGLLLGFEDKVAALLSAALPLSIHKFCDGLVIGVAMAKEVYAQAGDEAAGGTGTDTEHTRSPARFWRRLYQGPVGIWLLLTPITMIFVVLFAVATAGVGAGSGGVKTGSTNAPVQQVAVEMLASATHGGAAVGAVSTLAAVQAMGSGSFIYIGLGILSGEDLKGASANAALLIGVALTGGLFLLSSDSH